MPLNHLLLLNDSKPNSLYRFSCEVPLIVPFMARDALYLTVSIFVLNNSFSGYHISHSQDKVLQKNGKFLIKQIEEKCYLVYEYFQYLFWLYLSFH